ncbi:sulfurtransferase [Kaistia sp. 32K]|uniref:rhodanese-like domain-containing protein n=1 Tax=Kaistia sp. 32K TaxID=2795690 RepID=UPI001915CA56|nr:rhodanese-like domain-containing protein [Kaistia sp. 32K]BCP55494.1 sulfurtransferase [Kaistia sp. 32K]
MSEPDELALIDVREAKFYARGHINLSAHVALSTLEPQILRTAPRKSVPIVLVDEADGAAVRARETLLGLGYTDVRILAGGVAAWAANGYPLGTGYNTLVKTFSDLAHANYATPTITPAELEARLDGGGATTIIDCRPEQEHRNMTVAGAHNAPGVELALYDLPRGNEADHLYVISCFSRTRGIVGTTTLARLNGLRNVVFLEDGIMAAFLYGLPTGPGDRDLPPPGKLIPADVLRQQAEGIVDAHGLSVIDAARYAEFLAERDERTLYVFDVRPEAAYHEGHLPGSQSVPGGQLVMTYDVQVPVRHARIVLIDDPHLKRAAISAFWLSHFDDAEIHILPLDPEQAQVSDTVSPALPDDVRWLEIAEAEARLREGVTVIDVGPSLNYEQGHLPGANFVLRSALPSWLETHPAPAALLFTSPDGANAAYAASEIRRRFGIDAFALKGGTEAWRRAGLPLETEFKPEQLLSPFDDDWGSTMRAKVNREPLFRDYLAWERSLGHAIEQDDTVRFRWLAASAA